jgi:hypothetical protein
LVVVKLPMGRDGANSSDDWLFFLGCIFWPHNGWWLDWNGNGRDTRRRSQSENEWSFYERIKVNASLLPPSNFNFNSR